MNGQDPLFPQEGGEKHPFPRTTTRTTTPTTRSTANSMRSSDWERCQRRVTELLRKDLWSQDVAVVGTALDELGQILTTSRRVVHDDHPTAAAATATPTTATSSSSSIGAYVVQCGGVLVLMRLMEEYGPNESIQYGAMYALGQLARFHGETHPAIVGMEGLAMVVRAMQIHVHSSRLQQAGRSTLASLCRRGGIENN
jgi:hypothetical protein